MVAFAAQVALCAPAALAGTFRVSDSGPVPRERMEQPIIVLRHRIDKAIRPIVAEVFTTDPPRGE